MHAQLNPFEKKPTLWLVERATPQAVLVLVFVFSFALRLHSLGTVRVPSERQYRSAIIARGFYYQIQDSVPEWKKQVVNASRKQADLLEPPLQEMLAAGIYFLVNQENLWIPRFLASLFWMVGGIFLYRIARRLMSDLAAVLVTAYYLFLPIGVLTSISFQPDALMMAAFLASLLAMLRYMEKPSRGRLLAAASAASLAILVRPLCLFTITGAFLGLALYQRLAENRLRKVAAVIFFSLCFLPTLLYYSYTIATGRFIAAQAEASFLPHLLFDRRYWLGWLETATRTAGTAIIVGGLIGLSTIRKGRYLTFLGGMWVGYVVFCLTFTYHIRFSAHYHLQFAVIAALSFGPLIDRLPKQLPPGARRWFSQMLIGAACLFIMLITYRQIRQVLGAIAQVEPEATAREIGEIVEHSTETLYLAPGYGMNLEYYGELSGVYWPRSETHWALQDTGNEGPIRERSLQERFDAIDFAPEYFIITDFMEYNQYHPDLRAYLSQNFPIKAQSEEYLIYQMSEGQ